MSITVAQQQTSTPAKLNPTFGTTWTVTITPSAGSTLVVLVRGEAVTGSPSVTVADDVNAGNYTALDTLALSSTITAATFYKENVAAAVTTLTATYSATSDNMGLVVLEVTGGKLTGILDAHTGQIVASTAGTSGNMTSAGSCACGWVRDVE